MAQTKTTIWCLFSVENDYDQPENNLVRWWVFKPSIETLAKFMGRPLDKATDEEVVHLVNLWQGQRVLIEWARCAVFRLQEVAEGETP